MKTEQEYLQEAGVLYRRNTARFPLEQGETLLYYTWRSRITGNNGRDFVVLPYTARVAMDMLLRLIGRWNGSLAIDWHYST
jgi:hypothetical protein